MRRTITAALYLLVMYVLPLSGKPELLLHYKILISALFCLILLYTQPPVVIKEAEARKNEDRYSIFFILGAAALGQLVAVIEWGYFRPLLPSAMGNLFTVLGALMMVFGTLFRWWSIKKLGRFFTATVYVNEQQRIITDGPYALVRHPSYLGSFVAQLGSALFFHSGIGLLTVFFALGGAYVIRIRAEEATLVSAFGEEYRRYQQRCKRMIPCLW